MQEVVTVITPRFYETDAWGHINNATLAAWFEVARVAFLDTLSAGGDNAPRDWMLVSLQMDFLAETLYGADVTAKIVSAEAGNTSLTVHCEMWQGGRQVLRGSAVLVYMDRESRQSQRVPDAFRARIAAT